MLHRVLALCCILSAQLGLAVSVSSSARHRPSKVDFFQKQTSYAFVRFADGETVEAKGKDGSWIKCNVASRGGAPNSYNLRVADAEGAYILPAVPSEMLRRLLGPGERDFYVDNSVLNHSGSGVKYRFEKRIDSKMDDYAPWGTLVSGTDEHDGWVRVGLLNSLYLPTTVQGVRVLVPAGRDGPAPLSREEQEARGAARLASIRAAAPTKLQLYAPGDSVEYKSQAGEWFLARVAGAGEQPDTFRIMVMPTENTVYPINNVGILNLRKRKVAETTPIPQTQRFEAPATCASGGCITVTVKTPSGRDFILHTSKKNKVEMLMKMVCNKMRITWDQCQSAQRFTHGDRELSPWTHVDVAGLEDNSVVYMEAVQFPQDDDLAAESEE